MATLTRLQLSITGIFYALIGFLLFTEPQGAKVAGNVIVQLSEQRMTHALYGVAFLIAGFLSLAGVIWYHRPPARILRVAAVACRCGAITALWMLLLLAQLFIPHADEIAGLIVFGYIMALAYLTAPPTVTPHVADLAQHYRETGNVQP